MKDASGETRNDTSPAISSGRPIRPIRFVLHIYAPVRMEFQHLSSHNKVNERGRTICDHEPGASPLAPVITASIDATVHSPSKFESDERTGNKRRTERCIDGARSVRVDSNPLPPMVHRRALREPTHAELGRGVWTERFQTFRHVFIREGQENQRERRTLLARDRARTDDPPPTALGEHPRGRVLVAQERAAEVDRDHAVELVHRYCGPPNERRITPRREGETGRSFVQRPHGVDHACVRDHLLRSQAEGMISTPTTARERWTYDIEPSKPVDHVAHEALHVFLLRHAAQHLDRLPAKLAHRCGDGSEVFCRRGKVK